MHLGPWSSAKSHSLGQPMVMNACACASELGGFCDFACGSACLTIDIIPSISMVSLSECGSDPQNAGHLGGMCVPSSSPELQFIQ